MASYIIYINSDKVDFVNSWLKDPFMETPSFSKEDVCLSIEYAAKGYVTMIVNHDDFLRITSFLDEDSNFIEKGPIDRKKLLRETLRVLGDSPYKIYSPKAQTYDELLQIAVDIIEQEYRIEPK
jgi:hypothetical protein